MTDNFKIRFLTALWEDYLYTDNFKDTVIYKHIYEKEYDRAMQCKKSGKPGTSDLSRLILIYDGCSKGDFFLGLTELLSTSPKTFFEKKITSRRDASLEDTFLDELFRFFNEGAYRDKIFNPKDIPSLATPIKEAISGTKKLKSFFKSFYTDLTSLPKEKLNSISKKIDALEKRYPFMADIYETLICIGIQYKFISEFLYNYGVTISEQEYEIKLVKPEDDDNAEEIEESRPIPVFDKTNNSRKKDDTLGLITSCFENPAFLQKLLPNHSTTGEQTLDQINKLWLDYYNRYTEDKKAADFYDFNFYDYSEAFIPLTRNTETGVGLYIVGCEHFTDYDKDDAPLLFLPAVLSLHDFFDDEACDLFAKRSYIFNTEYNGVSVLSNGEIAGLLSKGQPEEILAAYYIKYTEAIEEAKEMLS